MSHISVRSTRIVDAKPSEVFKTLADYQTKRPRMLPRNYLDYTVEKGGQGGGTIISYRFHAAGRERPYRMQVEETIKGQVLTERDTGSSLVTRWSVVPVDNGQKSRVNVESDWTGGSGVGGFFERTFAPLGLRRVYQDALVALALMVQPPAENQDLLEATRKKGLTTRMSMYVLAASSALLLLLGGIKYLRTRAATV